MQPEAREESPAGGLRADFFSFSQSWAGERTSRILPTLGCIQQRRDGFGLAPHSFLRGVIERPLEAADVEVDNLAHPAIVSFQRPHAPDLKGVRSFGVKLADGNYYVGAHGEANTSDFLVSEFMFTPQTPAACGRRG